MELKRILLRRTLLLVILCFLGVLVLAVLRAEFDVNRESSGAQESGQLAQSLIALQSVPASALPELLKQLQTLNASGELRHVQIEVRGPDNQIRVAPVVPALPAWRATLAQWFAAHVEASSTQNVWHIARPEGPWQVKWLPNPVSEQQEALDNLLGLCAALFLLSVAVLLGMVWAVQGAFRPLRQILDAVAAYGRQDYQTQLPALPVSEMDQIGQALNQLSAQLRQVEADRKALSVKILTLQEAERTHLARELHDEMGQHLTALRADVAWLSRKMAEPKGGAHAELQSVVQGIAGHAEVMQQEIRHLLKNLRPLPVPLQDETQETIVLQPLLSGLMQSWQQRTEQRPAMRLSITPEDLALPQTLAMTLYRMTQEALTNVVKHAQASHVQVSIRLQEHGGLQWQVEDDGIGLQATPEAGALASAMQGGSGLAGMRERVWAHDGALRFAENLPHGVCLQADFPAKSVSAEKTSV